MKKYLPVIALLALIKLCIHLIGNRNYGFHRDELLHLAVSRHLAFGYMEFPPFIAFVGKLADWTFGFSPSGVRIFSTMAGIVILVVCCMMAKEMGGKKHAVALAGMAVLSFLPYYRNHCLFQSVAFDQMFWLLGFYILIKYINTQNNKFLIWLGIVAGLGLMNKYTFLVWGVGIAVGLLFYQRGKIYRNKWLYVAGIITFLIFVPNIIWQYRHHFPVLLHVQKLKESQLEDLGAFDFLLDQIKTPFLFAFSVLGFFALVFREAFKKFKCLAISIAVIFGLMWVTDAKGYYFYAAYPVLFAAASVQLESFFDRKPVWNYAIAAVLMLPVFFYLPKAIPILPIDSFVRYENLKPGTAGRYKLTDDYADMFGWEEQVKLLDSVYRSLPVTDREKCLLFAENYGEAGAIAILGERYGLPQPICTSGSFWLWGSGEKSGEVVLSIGLEEEVVSRIFDEFTLVNTINHPYAIEEENNISVYICRNPKLSLKKIWPTLEQNVFD